MKSLSLETKLIFGAIVIVVIYIAYKGWFGAAASVTNAAVTAAGGAVAGAATGVGSIIGIPNVNTQLCEQACAAGNTMDASAYCSLGRFSTYLVNGK